MKIAVVTSPITASAAEAFTLAMVEVADAAVIVAGDRGAERQRFKYGAAEGFWLL